MSSYTKILEDLHRTETLNPTIILPYYQQNETVTQQINSLLRQLRRAKSLRNRVETMIILWYLEEIIKTKTTTPTNV